ncbi:MAG: hypothetical protein ABUS51_02070 [Acidobacteriota bacterium]
MKCSFALAPVLASASIAMTKPALPEKLTGADGFSRRRVPPAPIGASGLTDAVVNLYRFTEKRGRKTSNMRFRAVTPVTSPKEMSGVRLAIRFAAPHA